MLHTVWLLWQLNATSSRAKLHSEIESFWAFWIIISKKQQQQILNDLTGNQMVANICELYRFGLMFGGMFELLYQVSYLV